MQRGDTEIDRMSLWKEVYDIETLDKDYNKRFTSIIKAYKYAESIADEWFNMNSFKDSHYYKDMDLGYIRLRIREILDN